MKRDHLPRRTHTYPITEAKLGAAAVRFRRMPISRTSMGSAIAVALAVITTGCPLIGGPSPQESEPVTEPSVGLVVRTLAGSFIPNAAGAEDSDDCNGNSVPDDQDVTDGISADCNANGLPDECEDCNENGVGDACDVAGGTSPDCDGNSVPDECDPDRNDNGTPDACDIRDGTSTDCNDNGRPDDCPSCEVDCNENRTPDACDIAAGTAPDCNDNGVPDECDLDCNANGIPDDCDIATGDAFDCTANGLLDDCEPDCNGNDTADDCDIRDGRSRDCDGDGVPDECHDVPCTLETARGACVDFELDESFAEFLSAVEVDRRNGATREAVTASVVEACADGTAQYAFGTESCTSCLVAITQQVFDQPAPR